MNPFNVILWYYEILINTGMCATGTPPLKINMSMPPTGGVCSLRVFWVQLPRGTSFFLFFLLSDFFQNVVIIMAAFFVCIKI